MSSVDILELKVSSIKKYLKLLEDMKGRGEIGDDLMLRGAVERYLYLAIQTTIELAEAIIAFKDFRRPSTYREAFEILSEEGIVEVDLCVSLMRMAGFRNFMSHSYEDFDVEKLEGVLEGGLVDLEKFIEVVVAKFLK